MPGRKFTSSSTYRYGFNGKENDKETVGTGEGTENYGMRIYNPALGKFLSVDPLAFKFAYYSPYHFAGNSPIYNIDLDGGEDKSYLFKQNEDGNGSTLIKVFDYTKTQQGFGDYGSGTMVIYVTNQGEVIKVFNAVAIEKQPENIAFKVGKALDGIVAKGVGSMENYGELEGTEHSPVLKAEIGVKATLTGGPFKGQMKAAIVEDGHGEGVNYVVKGSAANKLDKTMRPKFSMPSIYMNFTFNNDAGKNADNESKLNITIPIVGAFGITFSFNSGGMSNVELGIGLDKAKPKVELDGNGNIGKDEVKK